MELPLRNVRGRARRCAGATSHAVVAGDPRRRRPVVSRQRLAGRASAARDAHAAALDGVRASPIAGVLLTDAEIDHTAGLLLLRESTTPLRVFGEAGIEHALRDTLLRMLQRFCGVDWHDARTGARHAARGVEPGRRTVRRSARRPGSSSATDGGVVTYVPGLAGLDDGVLARFAASDLVLVDGTFWRGDELARLGISDRTAHDMGHVPLSGPGGTLEALAGLERPRKVLVHINNTNPILLEDSPEREQVVRAGVEVAYDGLEVEL